MMSFSVKPFRQQALQTSCQQMRRSRQPVTRQRHRVFASGVETPVDDKLVNDAPADAVSLLKKAAKDPAVPKKEVFKALRRVQKAKLQATNWDKIIGSNQFWRLVYTADKGSVQKSLKDEDAGSGMYFPLVACQKFDLSAPPEGRLQNGVYLPHIAYLEFKGPFTMKPGEKKLPYNLDELTIKLGPFQLGPFSIKAADADKLPFLIFFYADEDIICAQGKGGGIALWAKAEGDFLLQKGIA